MPYVQGIFAEDKWIKEQTVVTRWGPFYVLADYLLGVCVFFVFIKKKTICQINFDLCLSWPFCFSFNQNILCCDIFNLCIYLIVYDFQNGLAGEYSMMCLCTCRRCDLCIAYLSRDKIYVLHHRTLLQCRSVLSSLIILGYNVIIWLEYYSSLWVPNLCVLFRYF